ncbi:betaine/proline/choline family ABC transporter ATP-binding protein [Proteinivorax hydrogeniformans]|uniref:Quaternary amine transport ATP-binding protein n=1 Tax=Proteinivorax hydrogeniformans TaxID=1826727 RepID=A0AAU8HVV1_9FIRM
MIKFEGVTKIFADGFKALDSISFEVNKGELLVLIGPSGSGKTTTMRMINRLIDPTEGRIIIDGDDVTSIDPVYLRRNIGYVIQHIGLLPHMTIGDNVALVPKLKKMNKEEYIDKVDELLKMVGLDPKTYKERYPAELSGGQQQRIGVIRALAADPPIILMDEPFSALDPISREQLQEELVKLQEEIQKTIVFVTHDMDEALKIADRICLMRDGEVVQIDTPEKILRYPKNEFVKSFIGEDRLKEAETLPDLAEIMDKAITAKPTQGFFEAVKKMRKHKVDKLVIVEKEKYLGVAGVWRIQKHYRNEEMNLGDVMDKEYPTATLKTSTEEAVELVNKYDTSFLPILDGEGKVRGVVTRASIVEVMTDMYLEDGSD